MLQFVGIFVVLHGMVHLLYLAQSLKLLDLQTGMVWPDQSWVFTRLFGENATRQVASIACAVAAIGFVSGGTASLLGQSWWTIVVISAATFSAIAFLLLWNGKMQGIDQQGGLGVLINVLLILLVVSLQSINLSPR